MRTSRFKFIYILHTHTYAHTYIYTSICIHTYSIYTNQANVGCRIWVIPSYGWKLAPLQSGSWLLAPNSFQNLGIHRVMTPALQLTKGPGSWLLRAATESLSRRVARLSSVLLAGVTGWVVLLAGGWSTAHPGLRGSWDHTHRCTWSVGRESRRREESYSRLGRGRARASAAPLSGWGLPWRWSRELFLLHEGPWNPGKVS